MLLAMKTKSQVTVKDDLALAVKSLNALLKRDFGCDYAFIIMGKGHYVARHNVEGIIEPLSESDAYNATTTTSKEANLPVGCLTNDGKLVTRP